MNETADEGGPTVGPQPRSSLPPWPVKIEVLGTSEMLKDSMLIVGFPTHGLVGSITTAFLVDALKMVPLAEVDSEALPPTVTMRDGIVESPIHIYASGVVCGPDKKCSQLLVAVSEIQPEPALLNPLGTAIVAWAEDRGVRMILVVEGEPTQTLSAQESLQVVAIANKAGESVLKSSGFLPASGMLTGFGAAILRAGLHQKIPILCLVAETTEGHPDARAAEKIIESIQPMVPQISLDPEPLRQQAQLIEAAQRKALQGHRDSVRRLTTSEPAEMYR